VPATNKPGRFRTATRGAAAFCLGTHRSKALTTTPESHTRVSMSWRGFSGVSPGTGASAATETDTSSVARIGGAERRGDEVLWRCVEVRGEGSPAERATDRFVAKAAAELIRPSAVELQLFATGGVERPVGGARPDLGDERCLVERICVGSNAGPRPARSRLIAIWGETQRYGPSGYRRPGPSPARRASRGGRRRRLL
jgi:hypothetical protein